MRTKEKIAILDKFNELQELDHSHFEIIAKLVFDKDDLVRSQCAALLINFVNEESKNLLFRLAQDKYDLVRTESYDSLGDFFFDDVEAFLAKAIKTELDALARRYAILSWANVVIALQQISAELVSEIEKLKAQEKAPDCALSYCYALYTFGNKHMLNEILPYLKDSDYHVRCTTISFLADIIDETNEELIKGSIEELLVTEGTIAVRSKAEEFLNEH
jgi:HEAT repeat protein